MTLHQAEVEKTIYKTTVHTVIAPSYTRRKWNLVGTKDDIKGYSLSTQRPQSITRVFPKMDKSMPNFTERHYKLQGTLGPQP